MMMLSLPGSLIDLHNVFSYGWWCLPIFVAMSDKHLFAPVIQRFHSGWLGWQADDLLPSCWPAAANMWEHHVTAILPKVVLLLSIDLKITAHTYHPHWYNSHPFSSPWANPWSSLQKRNLSIDTSERSFLAYKVALQYLQS